MHDFTKKNWVEYTEIMLPENAPKEYKNRSTLWNAVEKAEKSSDAQLAREVEVALPNELTREEQLDIVRNYIKQNFVDKGMCADFALHNPPVMNDRHQPIDCDGNPTKDKSKMQFINPHAHILLTVRPMDAEGKWEAKSKIEYLCKRGDEENGFTAVEFKQAQGEGWEKQYQFKEGKKKKWYTISEGLEKELERVSKNPRTTPYGRKNATLEEWNSKDRIFEWRKNWEEIVNNKFEELGEKTRIDSRSYINQGKEEIPTIHMGTSAVNMDKRAMRELRAGADPEQIKWSDIGTINKEIKERNLFSRKLKQKIETMIEKASKAVRELARNVEGIRAKLIGNEYENTILKNKYADVAQELMVKSEQYRTMENELERLVTMNKDSANRVEELEMQLQSCTRWQIKKVSDLRKQIQNEQEKIENRMEYGKNYLVQRGFSSIEEFRQAVKKHQQVCKEYEKVNISIQRFNVEKDKLLNMAETKEGEISSEKKNEYEEERRKCRLEFEGVAITLLEEKHKRDFDKTTYRAAQKEIDKHLNSDEDAGRNTETAEKEINREKVEEKHIKRHR